MLYPLIVSAAGFPDEPAKAQQAGNNEAEDKAATENVEYEKLKVLGERQVRALPIGMGKLAGRARRTSAQRKVYRSDPKMA